MGAGSGGGAHYCRGGARRRWTGMVASRRERARILAGKKSSHVDRVREEMMGWREKMLISAIKL
jgi:hypothetical protein